MAEDEEPSFLDKKVEIDFNDLSTLHDRTLVVEGKKFYVTSNHLCMFSEYFNGLFNCRFQEANESEIELKDVKAEEFEIFLKMLYPLDVKVTNQNLGCLIKLSHMFLTPVIWQKCTKYLENPFIFQYFDLADLLTWMSWSNSETLKKRVEDRCIGLFKDSDMARFVEIAARFKLDSLKEHILKHVYTNKGIILNKTIAYIALGNDFTVFEEHPLSDIIHSNRVDKIDTMFTFIMMLKYDLPELEDWLTDNFDRLMVKPLSIKNVQLLMAKLDNLSTKHKRKLENILSDSLESMKEKKLSVDNKQGLKNFLPEFAFLLFKNDIKTVVAKSMNLLKEFPCNLNLSDIQKTADGKLYKCFAKNKGFRDAETVLKNKLTSTKLAMQKYLKKVNKETLMKNSELIRMTNSSPAVAEFVRECLSERKDGRFILMEIIAQYK